MKRQKWNLNRMLLYLRNFWCWSKNMSRLIEEIPQKEINAYITKFIITIQKKDNNEDYKPSSLRSLMASFDRYLKKKNYGFSIMKDAEFEQACKALQSKQKDLKQKGKGNKPNASVALTEEEIKLRTVW